LIALLRVVWAASFPLIALASNPNAHELPYVNVSDVDESVKLISAKALPVKNKNKAKQVSNTVFFMCLFLREVGLHKPGKFI
jgi:hypothetical protein